jgi:hypothetical protein
MTKTLQLQPAANTERNLPFENLNETSRPQNGVMLRHGFAVHTGCNLQ